MDPAWPMECRVHDILDGPVAPGGFDAAYSLDVIEHIAPDSEETFLQNLCASIGPDGAAIIGTPSAESQAYASVASRAGHVNCKRGPELRALMEKYFRYIAVFSMNDEVVHTGFQPMAHYLLALATGKR
jgi:2-polyprenyl-3-methyl-5-hydroxy-6-metoxy-1,4-benzoquinol methylase